MQSISNFRSLGFWSLLASGILSICYWLFSDQISIQLQTHDVVFVGAIVGLGLDLFFRNTLIGKLLICALNAFYISIFFHIFRLTLGSNAAREIREEVISKIQAELRTGGLSSTRDEVVAINSASLVNEITMLRGEVDFLMDEIANLDGQFCELQKDFKKLWDKDNPQEH